MTQVIMFAGPRARGVAPAAGPGGGGLRPMTLAQAAGSSAGHHGGRHGGG